MRYYKVPYQTPKYMTRNSTSLSKQFKDFNRISSDLDQHFQSINQSLHHLLENKEGASKADAAKGDLVSGQETLLLDALPAAVIMVNTQGVIFAHNALANEWLGKPLDGCSWVKVIERVFEPDLDQGELISKQGRQFSIATRPLGYKPGQAMLLTEVTSTRQLQKAAFQNRNLVTMGKMMASLAHQLRTPLSTALLYLSQIEEQHHISDKKNFVGKSLKQIRHIEKTINDMLMFAHGGHFLMSRFSNDDLMLDLEEQMLPIMEMNQAKLEIKSGKGIQLNGNRDALLGVFTNICNNAIDASSGELLISIDVLMDVSGMVKFHIRDNASGMDNDTLQHVFDPFYSTKEDGTGLGMAVVKSVVESHQGTIEVKSIVNRGTEFIIQLPSITANKTQQS